MFSAYCQNCRFTEEKMMKISMFWRLKDILVRKSVRLIPFTDKNDSHKASKSEISQFTKF